MALALSGCGGPTEGASRGGSAVTATSQPIDADPTLPIDAATSQPLDVEAGQPSDAMQSTSDFASHGDVNCALQGMLPWAQFVVVGDRVVVDGEVRFEGSWTVAAPGARWGEGNRYQEVRAPSDGEGMPFSLPGWEAPDGEVGGRVLALIGNGLGPETGPAVIAIARTSPDVAILGECGEVWNAAIAEVAGTDDPTAIAELLMAARGTPGLDQGMTATMLAIDDAQAGIER